MRAASAIGFAAPPCCCCQYCITMAMLAAPQPSFCCFTNGTSSQRLEGLAAKSTPQTPSRTTVLITRGGMGLRSTHRDNDQNESGDGNYDDNQVAVAESAGGKVGPRPVRPGSQLRQFSIAQAGNRILHPLRVGMSRLQGLLCLLGGEELLQGFQILLPYAGGIHRRFL